MDITISKGLMAVRNDSTNAYLKDINKFPVLTPDEEVDLFYQAKDGDTKARDMLINCNQRFIFAVAKRYATDEKLMDLVGEGNIGLIKSIDSFDPTIGTRFLTHAIWFIRRSIVQYLINENNLIRKTNNAKTSFHLTKVKNKFFCQNGRFPSDNEIMDIFDEEYGIKIQDMRDLTEIEMNSINTTFDGDDSNAFENSVGFTSKTSSVNNFEKETENEYNNTVIATLLSSLKERDRKVMAMAYGIGYSKEYTNAEIADELGLTAERVRQIQKNAVKKMQNFAKSAAI